MVKKNLKSLNSWTLTTHTEIGQPQLISSETLFMGAKELLIEHRSEIYRLRQTSQGKLILTK
jgi:hemin uptake protein HemP